MTATNLEQLSESISAPDSNTGPIGLMVLVNSLCFGGAEKHVVSLLNNMDVGRFRLSLAYLKRDEMLLPQIQIGRLQSIFCCDVASKIDLRAIRLLATRIDELAIDLVVCTNTYSMLYGLLAKLFARRPVKLVEIFHTTLLQTAKAKLQMRFYRPVFRHCDLLVYVCKNQQSYWLRQGLRAKAERVIYNGVDLELYTDRFSLEQKQAIRAQFGFAKDDYLIGICAALRPEKAHGDLLDAIKSMHSHGIAAKCLIIGEGIERNNIERRIAQLELGQHVVITGFQQDVRPFIAVCDVVTLVSHTETLSIATLEAMALGKPIVMSNVGGADEQVVSNWNGYLFEPGDIHSLTDHLTRLSDPLTRAAFATRARERVVEHFSLPKMIRDYEATFRSMAFV